MKCGYLQYKEMSVDRIVNLASAGKRKKCVRVEFVVSS
jgi:hypothetical protein